MRFLRNMIRFALVGMVCAASASELKIRGTKFGNWFIAGEQVGFTAAGELEDGQMVDVRVFDAAGNPIVQDRIAGKVFKEAGWRHEFVRPGYYEAEFSVDGKILSESFTAEVKRNSPEDRSQLIVATSQKVPVLRHGFMVASHPTRPAKDISPVFGASPHMEFYQTALPLAALVGINSIRLHAVPWYIVEPSQGKYDWRYPDDVMKVANQYGFANSNIIINTFGTPRWASSHPGENWFDNCVWAWSSYAPSDFKLWEDYITALVTRYPGVRAVELLNEPNFPGFSCFWHDTPENFLTLMKTGYQAVKKASPQTQVWFAGGPGATFYEQFLRNGGDGFFDVIPVHGNVSGSVLREAENKAKAAHKPMVNSEWHACILVPNTDEFPSDRELARKMLLSFLTQENEGVEEIYLFSMMNIWNSERESLKFYRDNQYVISHVSGLFRRAPYAQPRYMAASWHTIADLVKGKLRIGKGYSFSDAMAQNVQMISSDAEPLMIVWNQASVPMMAHPDILRAAAGCQVLRADGSIVDDFANEKLETDIYYIVRSPDCSEVAKWKNEYDLLKRPKAETLLSRQWKASYSQQPLFHADMTGVPRGNWVKVPTRVTSDTNASCADLEAYFTVAIAGGKMDLAVKVEDKVHHADPTGKAPWNGDSVQFCIDTRNRGVNTDQVELIATLEKDGGAILRKVVSPAIGGDLPSNYTAPGKLPGAQVTHADCRIERKGEETFYRIRLDLVELYPLVFQSGDELRFSLLVNNNDGNGRAAWWEWSSGIGSSKNPQEYGTLIPFTGKQALFVQQDLTIKGWEGDFIVTTADNKVRVETKNSIAAGIRTPEKEVIPGGSYKIRFAARGNINFLILKAAGKSLQMFDVVSPLRLTGEWQAFECLLTIPKQSKDCAISFLAWDQRDCWYEIKDFSVEGL